MNTSIIDHRPMLSTNRYSRVLSRSRVTLPSPVMTSMVNSATSLKSGTTMLAISTSSANGHICACASSITPPMIVLGSPCPNRISVRIG